MAVNVELRNYAVEIALEDYIPKNKNPTWERTIESEVIASTKTWMDPAQAVHWRTRRNAGYTQGLVFDSKLDITVKDDDGNVLDQFKGSECVDLTYVHKEYSAAPFRRCRRPIYKPRVTAMEISGNGYQRSRLPIDPRQYSRDLIHIGLSKVHNTGITVEYELYIKSLKVFVIDLDTQIELTTKNNKTHSVNACIEEIQMHGPTYEQIFVHTYAYREPKKFHEANIKDCDTLYKNLIRRKIELKEVWVNYHKVTNA
jgi:hypothetical protein